MKVKNFRVHDAIYVVTGNHELDLHNCYDFRTLMYDVHNRVLTMDWTRTEADWVRQDQPANLRLALQGVSSLEFRPRDPALPFTEDDCLANIGHLSDRFATPDIFTSNEPPDDEWKWGFEFMSGARIVVQAESIEAKTEPEHPAGPYR